MKRKMTKKQVLTQFKDMWVEIIKRHPHHKGDSIQKREWFSSYVDMLNKDGMVSDKQAFTWSNPF